MRCLLNPKPSPVIYSSPLIALVAALPEFDQLAGFVGQWIGAFEAQLMQPQVTSIVVNWERVTVTDPVITANASAACG